MSPRVRMLVPVALLAIFAIGGWRVESQRSRQRSVLSGFFESQPTQVASRIGGRVARVLVREGEAVVPMQPLLELEAAPARSDATAKEQAAEQARQQLREAEKGPRVEEIRRQEGAVAEARANLSRLRNGPRPEELRRQEAVVAEARANLSRLRSGPRPEEIDQARAALRQAEAQHRRILSGSRPEEVRQARAAERNAAARLAAAERGPTPEERAQAKARLDAALAQEALARSDSERYRLLYDEKAVSRQRLEQAVTAAKDAAARRGEAQEAWRQVEAGTPKEELEQARQFHLQAKAALDLAQAGSRAEDIEAAAAAVEQQQQALRSLLRGSRVEDLRAAEARLEQQTQGLRNLQRGSRAEDIRAAEARLEQQRQALLALRAGSREEQLAQARAAVAAAEATAASSAANLAERMVRSPHAGVVERIPVTVGDLVGAGTPLVRLDSPMDIWMRVYIPEAELARVSVGDVAELRVDGVSAPILGYVESIATRGEFTPANLQTPRERGKQVFAVRLRLKERDPRVKAGMYATVTRIGLWRP